ncbi:Transcription initiation factor IID 18kDa subunit [Botryosphaeria dothidea]|uniref:Transcription initiation factor IID 18kDa subunit n=1 Tax=Botryosphaeria dothidea TaxID=55169 RepID=A0A8H4IKL2_9PEZI|nr:Transcription initiation factor IID 18kDa subunit [Botryosphaeria dothidea]
MMFVAGETADLSPETTSLVESIVRQQVIELLTRSTDLAHRRGAKITSAEDLIFLIRHDTEKVSRLQTFLSWKELRKNAKEKDDKSGADALDDGDLADVDVLPLDGAAAEVKARRTTLPWDASTFFAERAPELEGEDPQDAEQDAEQDGAQLRRLALADERTRRMTRDEYCEWAEARQATFTRRKRAKFRQWAGLGAGTGADGKVGEDVMDVLGFLTFQMVQTLTEEALRVKGAELAFRGRDGTGRGHRETVDGLFSAQHALSVPVEPCHVQEAFRRLQRSSAGRGVRPQAAVRRSLKLF